MQDNLIRVPLDPETMRRLRERALSERRATADQAAVILTRALTRRPRRVTADPEREAVR